MFSARNFFRGFVFLEEPDSPLASRSTRRITQHPACSAILARPSCGDDMKSSTAGDAPFSVAVKGQALAATSSLSHVLRLACDRRLQAFRAIALAAVPNQRFTAHRPHSPRLLSHSLSPRFDAPRKYSCLDIDADQLPQPTSHTQAACLAPSTRQRHPENGQPRGPQAPGPNGGAPHLTERRGRIPRHDGPDHPSTRESLALLP